jgi:hypothetical protein
VSGVRLAYRSSAFVVPAARRGDRLEPHLEQMFVELRGRLLRVGVIGLVGDHVVAARREARNTRRVGSVQARDSLLPSRSGHCEGLDTRLVACDRRSVAAVTDAEPEPDTLVETREQVGWLDPEFVRHPRRGPGRKHDG